MKFFLFLFLLVPTFLKAAVINLAPGGTLNWSNVQPGDVIQLESGNYKSLVVGKSGTTSAPIIIKGPVSGQAVFSGGMDNPGYNNITFDGNQNSGDLIANTRKYGIKLTQDMQGGRCIDAGYQGPVANFTIRNIDCLGPYATESNPIQNPNAPGAQGIDICHDYPITNLLVSDCRILGFGTCFRQASWNGAVVEKCYLGDIANDGLQHEDIIYSYPSTNVTFRNNLIRNSPNDGVFFEYGDAVNFQFFDNIFYNSSGWYICTKKGSKGYGPVKIWNNLFAGPKTPPVGFAAVSDQGTGWATGSDVSNNVFIYVDRDTGTAPAANNAYNMSGKTGGFQFDDSGCFVDPAHGNYRLTAKGVTALGGKGKVITGGPAELAYDFDGVPRGTSWTPGPFVASTGGGGPTPTATPAPTATPTPAPSSTPTPVPGGKFKVGDTVTPTAVLNVRSTPSGTVVGTHRPGDSGTVTAGPQMVPLRQDVNWYEINWTTSPSTGWSGDDDLAKTAAPSPTPTPAPTATPAPTPGATYDKWIQKQNDWTKQNPPTPD